MKIKNLKDVETFLNVVNECKGDVTLTSQYEIGRASCRERV